MPSSTKEPNPTLIQFTMKYRYEALLILDIKGKEDGAKEVIERLEKVFTKEGAAIEQVQRLDKRQFSYVAGKLDHGYYVNFVFEADPAVIEKLRTKFELDEDIYRQHYLRVKSRKAAPAEAAA
jgi:small subunit ribosomal protein S6